MPPAVAIGAAAVGSVAGSVIGANAQKKAAKSAQAAELAAVDKNNALARETRDINLGLVAPYNQQGQQATTGINALLAQGPYSPALSSSFVSGMNPGSFDDFREDTGYQFRLDEGLEGVGESYLARGAGMSGPAAKALVRYGQDFASNEYDRWNQRRDRYFSYKDAWGAQERGFQADQRNNYFNQLAGQQGVGLNAVGAALGANNAYSGQVMAGNNQASAATANAALARGQATSGMYSGIGNALGSAAGLYYMGGPGGFGGKVPFDPIINNIGSNYGAQYFPYRP